MTEHDGHSRWQRNFADLLQELRVAQTGVQILFAFLLMVPFNARFPEISALGRWAYLVALLSAAAAVAMIIAPVAFHRALFRQGRKDTIVLFAHRMAIGGLVMTLVAMVSSVLLVTDMLLDRTLAWAVSGTTTVLFVVLWMVVPAIFRDEDAEPLA